MLDTLSLVLLATNLLAAVPLGAALAVVRGRLPVSPAGRGVDLLTQNAVAAGLSRAPEGFVGRVADLDVTVSSERRPTIDGPRHFVVARVRLPADTWFELALPGDPELSLIATPFGEPVFDRLFLTVGTLESRSRLHPALRGRLLQLARELVKVRLRSGVLIVASRFGARGPDVAGILRIAVDLTRLLLAESNDPVDRVIARVRGERDPALRMAHLKHLATAHAGDDRVKALATALLEDGEPVCRLAGAQILGRADVALTIVTYRLAGAAVRRAAGLVVAKHGDAAERAAAARALTAVGPDACAAVAVPLLAPLGQDAEPLLLELFALRPTFEVARRLGDVGTQASLPLLLRASAEGNPVPLRQAAVGSVARIRRLFGDASGGLSLADPAGGALAIAESAGGQLAPAEEDPLAGFDALPPGPPPP